MSSGETIPLIFQGQDELTALVKVMTEALVKLSAAHEKQEDSAEDAEKAEKSLGDTLAEVADTTAIAERAAQLAGFAWEIAGAAYEKLTGFLTASLDAWDEQSKKSGRSASALGSVAEASAKLDKEATRLLAQLGKMIERSGSIQVTYTITAEVLEELRKILKDVETQSKDTGGSLGGELADGAAEFFGTISENAEDLAKFLTALGLLDNLVRLNLLGIGAFVDMMQYRFYEVLQEGADAVDTLLLGLEQLLLLSGKEIPQGFINARFAVQQLGIGAEQLGNKQLGEVATGAIKARDAIFEMAAEAASVDTLRGQIERLAAAGKKAAEDAKAALDKGGNKGRGDLVTAEEAAAEKRAAALLDLDRQILEAQRDKNDLRVVELEREKALVELSQSLREIKTSTLRTATEQTEGLRIQLEYEASLKELADAREADRRAAYEIESGIQRELLEFEEQRAAAQEERARAALDAIEARREAELERIDAVSEAATEGFGGIADIVGDMTDETTQLVAALEQGFGAAARLGASLTKLTVSNKSFKDSQEEVSAAISAGAGLASALVGAYADSIKERARYEAAINAAAAIAAGAFALSGYPGFAGAAFGHAAAAVKFGLIAGGAIGSGGGATSAGGGAAAGAGPTFQAPDMSRERELNAEAIARAIAEEGRGGATVINVDFGSSLILGESPEAARRITDLVTPELLRVIG